MTLGYRLRIGGRSTMPPAPVVGQLGPGRPRRGARSLLDRGIRLGLRDRRTPGQAGADRVPTERGPLARSRARPWSPRPATMAGSPASTQRVRLHDPERRLVQSEAKSHVYRRGAARTGRRSAMPAMTSWPSSASHTTDRRPKRRINPQEEPPTGRCRSYSCRNLRRRPRVAGRPVRTLSPGRGVLLRHTRPVLERLGYETSHRSLPRASESGGVPHGSDSRNYVSQPDG